MNESKPSVSKLGRWLVPATLLIPLLVILNFHMGNLRLFEGFDGAFIKVPFRFLTNLGQFRLIFPEGLIAEVLRTFVVICPAWLLGRGILGNAVRDRLTRSLVAFPIGLGPVGVVLEGLAMVGWLTTPLVVSVYLIAALVGLVLTYRAGLESPRPMDILAIGRCGSPLRVVAWTLSVGIVLLSFEHAIFFPPTYHDALIYYLYYSKLIFLSSGIPFPVDADGFPELVQCQVGLGLGANYPHLFLIWQASVCRVFGRWSSIPGQLLPPLAGLATALLVYTVVLRRYRSERLGLWAMLLVQSVPYWLWYQNWVSDYPLAVWLTIASVALVASADSHRLRVLAGLVAIAVAGSHLNYLMVTLWWFPLVFWLSCGKRRFGPEAVSILLVGLILSSLWFVRNQIVTGNPVYAFFPNLFGGLNIDPDVLRSCEVEWNSNGDGFNMVGYSFFQRLTGLADYFVTSPRLSIKWAALPVGWFLPGLVAFLIGLRKDKVHVAVLGYTLFLYFYGLAISGTYLYHIMPLVPLMVLVSCEWMTRIDRSPRWVGGFHTLLIILIVATIGLPAAIYGSKRIAGSVDHTLSPGMNPQTFLSISEIGPYYRMWRVLDARLPEGSVILTHENRHYYLRDDLVLLHLDDYRLIPWYDRSPAEVEERLEEMNVDYYLRIPNENNHPIVKRLGIDELLDTSFQFLEGNDDRSLALYVFTPR